MENTIFPSPLVMVYTEDAGKAQQISVLCSQLGMRMRRLAQADANLEVGQLAGIGGKKQRAAVKAPVVFCLPELMIFSGLPDGKLEQFLEAYKMAGIAPVALKAIVTPYNFNWSVYELAQELIKERTAMMMERRKD